MIQCIWTYELTTTRVWSPQRVLKWSYRRGFCNRSFFIFNQLFHRIKAQCLKNFDILNSRVGKKNRSFYPQFCCQQMQLILTPVGVNKPSLPPTTNLRHEKAYFFANMISFSLMDCVYPCDYIWSVSVLYVQVYRWTLSDGINLSLIDVPNLHVRRCKSTDEIDKSTLIVWRAETYEETAAALNFP